MANENSMHRTVSSLRMLFDKSGRLRLYAIALLLSSVAGPVLYWTSLVASHEQLRSAVRTQAEQRANQLADAVAKQMDAMIVAADFAVHELRDNYAAFDHRNFEVTVKTVHDSFPPNSVTQIGAIDAEGWLTYSDLGTKAHTYLGDREHFLVHVGGKEDRLFISKPVLGRVSQTWSIQFSRPMWHRGKFAGVMVLSLSPEYLSRELAALNLSGKDVVSLFHPDGTYLARSRDSAGALGKSIPSEREFLGARASATGVLRLTAAYDKVDRVYAWHRHSQNGIITVVGLELDSIMAPIEAQITDSRWRSTAGIGLLMLLAAAIAFLLFRISAQQKALADSEALHRGTFATMAEGVCVVDRHGQIVRWNDEALRILDVDAEGLVARHARLLRPDGTPLPKESFPSARAARGDFVSHEVVQLRRIAGANSWIRISSRPLRIDDKPGPDFAIVSFSDITPLVEAENSLRLAKSVFDATSEGIVVTDAKLRVVAVNAAFGTITGYGSEEVMGKEPPVFQAQRHNPSFYRTVLQRLEMDGHWEGEVNSRRKDGELIVEWLKVTLIRDDQGRPHRYVALFSDVTQRKQQEEIIWHQANFDALSGLPNRQLLEDRIERAIAQASRKRSQVAVLFVDLDRFKPVNDQFGHAVGDDLLRQVARRLENSLRDEDTVARLGGDEFVAVLPDLLVSDAPARAAEKIVALLSAPFRVDGHFIEISCSIGIALFPRDGDSATALLDRADRAMYRAKDAGRGTWEVA